MYCFLNWVLRIPQSFTNGSFLGAHEIFSVKGAINNLGLRNLELKAQNFDLKITKRYKDM